MPVYLTVLLIPLLIKRIKKIPNLKGQEIIYPGEQKFLRTKTNSKKSIKIPINIKKDLDILLAN